MESLVSSDVFSSLSKSDSQCPYSKLCKDAVVEAVSKGVHNSPQLKRSLFETYEKLLNLSSHGDIKCSETKFNNL